MTERPKTSRLVTDRADIKGWAGILIVAVGGAIGSWMSYHEGSAVAAAEISQLKIDVQEIRAVQSHALSERHRLEMMIVKLQH